MKKLTKANTPITILILIWAILQIIFNTIYPIDAISFRAFHAMAICVFSVMVFNKNPKDLNYIKFLNFILVAGIIFVFSYFLLNYNIIAKNGGFTSERDLMVSLFAIILIFICGFRINKNITLLALVFLLYLFFGKYFPSVIGHNGFSIKRILNHMFWGSQGIFGVSIGVSATYIFLFILFGSFLKYSGFTDLINDLALYFVGNTVGGPGKVAVLISALLGMINGSAVANVATTGTITIPMMKKSGYSKEFAAAVEATASTGGQFTPPIMGAVGFLMAEFLAIPYGKVILAAAIPAFLYYLGIFLSVHLESKKLGLKSETSKEKSLSEIIKNRGILILPLFVLILFMFLCYTPIFASVSGIIAAIISSWFVKEHRMGFVEIIEATVDGATSTISIGLSCLLIGIIIGTVSLSSLGLNLGFLILNNEIFSSSIVTAILVMIMSTILGMGVPGVAAYVIVVSIAVPIMIKNGISPIPAHLFCLIYACLSNITPPVAMSSYVASGIAKSNVNKTSILSVKIGIIGFIIPFFFIKNEMLLLGASEFQIYNLYIILTSIIGVFEIVCGFSGFIDSSLKSYEKILLICGGLLLINSKIYTDVIGILIFIIIYVMQKRRVINA